MGSISPNQMVTKSSTAEVSLLTKATIHFEYNKTVKEERNALARRGTKL